MYTLPEKLKNIIPYKPDDVSGLINLNANESCFSLSEKTLQSIKEKISICFNRYPDPLAKNLVEKYAEFYNLDKDCITAGNGSDELISLILQAFLTGKDRYIVLEPDFSMYAFYGKLLGLNFASYKKDSNLKINFGFLSDYINRNKINAIIFSNPCNPTSLVEKKQDVLNFVKSVNCLVVIDEAYMDFCDESVINYVTGCGNLIVLRTLSKAFSMASLRLGFTISGKTITTALRAVKSPYNVNTASALIGSIALEDKDYINSCIKNILNYRENLKNEILKFNRIFDAEYKMFDSAANFLYIKTKRCKQ
ncbi:MAG: histidinol-phosphate aminotransferase family protein, partial [Firmicutes bacterium]|nr:histidinol-phosphate aminotransferase family protein [Bacillota bacterium]